MALQEKEAETKRLLTVSLTVAVVALLAVVFAVYFFHQKRLVSEKNRALVRMINSIPKKSAPPSISSNTDSELFKHIDATIRIESLYANIGLQRQDICNRFNISRHTLNNLLAEHADGLSFPQYINNLRLEEVLLLLREKPDKKVSDIAAEVGFTPANLREQFKRKYGMTPAEYRMNQ